LVNDKVRNTHARTTHSTTHSTHNTSQHPHKTQQYAYDFTRSFFILQDGVSAAAVFVEMAEQLKRQGKVTN
jgi:hypothetical protein